MRLEQLEAGTVESVRLVIEVDELPAELARGAEIAVVRPDGDEEVFVRAGRVVAAAHGATRRDRRRIDAICATGLPRLTWVLEAYGPSRELLIQAHTFAGRLQGGLSLVLDDRAIDDAARVSGVRRSARAVQDWLTDECLLAARAGDETGVRERAFLGAGTGRGLEDAFTVHGRTLRLEVRRQVSKDGQARHVVMRVIRGRGREDPGRLFLTEGAITFVDGTAASIPRSDIQAQLAQLGVESGGVIDLWKRWHSTEAEAILQRARAFGAIPYVRVDAIAEHQRVFTIAEAGHERLVESLRDEELECAATPPPILSNPAVTWEEYEQQAHGGRPFVGKVVMIERREGLIVLRRAVGGELPPPDKGVLFASILGDRTRLRRQREAAEAIGTGTNPMRQLGLLIEDRDALLGRAGTSKLGRAARRKVFGARGPTPKQEAAIRMALNTPDVALIQGPPGTGKTTVINALVEQLNELGDSSDGVDQILLSGFQHDAVENAIARMSVNGLPAIKFGSRSGSVDEEDAADADIDRWCQERAEQLRKKVSPRSPSALVRAIEDMVEGYLLAPLPRAATAELLGRIATQVCGQISAELSERMRGLERELAARDDTRGADHSELVRRIRALRTTAVSFADDGPITARRLLQILAVEDEVSAEVVALLERAAAWHTAEVPPFLGELAAGRRRLLRANATDAFPDAQPRLREDVARILAEVRDALAAKPVGSQDAIEEAAAELLAAYEGDPDLVRRSILAYMAVAGATCQQSKRLFTTERGEEPYQTVIVDEAARANPLDLFIPIAQAARRIVLVGDHRQLPHILDRQLELELEWALRKDASPAAERTKELLGRSLFQQLFENLARRQAQGEGMRVITLDEQFRMHPTLGDFVSREFYAPHGEGFRSPLPAAAFAHDLPGYPGPAAWLDVGRAAHGTEEPGQSKSRPAEAKAIARELARLIDAPAGATLNFGIITFYSAQVDSINEELRKRGFIDDHDHVVDAYRDLVRPGQKRVDRLKVGTVDAFQGMEFDVVFLSMVRCNGAPDRDELERRRKYGHLMSPNRLCVSMSRQQRLLVVAGDPGMLREPNAETAIGPLVRFHALARELGGAVR